MFGTLSNELLLAIPFFTFMGAILERSRLAEDMLEGFGQLFGPVRGGLAYAVIFVGAIFGAITGTVAASVIAMAMIALPVMIRYGYNMKLAPALSRRRAPSPSSFRLPWFSSCSPINWANRSATCTRGDRAFILQVILFCLYICAELHRAENDAGAAHRSTLRTAGRLPQNSFAA